MNKHVPVSELSPSLHRLRSLHLTSLQLMFTRRRKYLLANETKPQQTAASRIKRTAFRFQVSITTLNQDRLLLPPSNLEVSAKAQANDNYHGDMLVMIHGLSLSENN